MAQRSGQSTAIVQLLVELAGVGAMALLAGMSEEFANAMLIIMLGFWMLFVISRAGILTSVVNAFTTLAVNPANSSSGSSGYAVPTNA
jgi:hypothetical protein